MVEQALGTKQGEATFYVVNEFHGFSTTIADNADAALTQLVRTRARSQCQ